MTERSSSWLRLLLGRWWRNLQPEAAYPTWRTRFASLIAWLWRGYAILALVLIQPSVDKALGPSAEPAFGKFHGADFGGFYTGATIVHEGTIELLGDLDTQRATQARIQAEENLGWRWFNPLPHPPVLSYLTQPIAQLPIRTAYWLWMLGSFIAAAIAAYTLARTLCPRVPVATTIIFLTFEPLWHLTWWGQVDAYVFLPVALGIALLLRARSPADDLLAGLLMSPLALIPQYAIVPALGLLLARRWAAAGMAAGGSGFTLASFWLVGRDGLDRYREMAEYFGAFTGTDTVTEWAMFNVRGWIMRTADGQEISLDLLRIAVWTLSITLAALAVLAAGKSLRTNQTPDLAIAVLVMASVLTSYHSHRQTLVFFFAVFAVFIGRSLWTDRNPLLALLWMVPVTGMHAAAAILPFDYPIAYYPVQRYLTPPSLLVLLLLATALLIPPVRGYLRRSVQPLPARWSADYVPGEFAPSRTLAGKV